MKTIYTTTVVYTGGRAGGRSEASDGSLSVAIAPPGVNSGKGEKATNPEQHFAAGYSACFNGALAAALRNEKIKYKEANVTATVHLRQDDQTGYSIAVDLTVKIDDFSREDNQKFADLAHQICPYSKAVQGNIDVTVQGL